MTTDRFLLVLQKARLESLLLTPRELALLLRLGRNKTYEFLASGEIPVIRFGRAIRIPRAAVEEWIERNAGVGRKVDR